MSEAQLMANIIPIKIIMNTNIPDSHIVEFTSNLLYHPELKNISNLEKYPLFTNLYKYDEQTIMNKPYDKIVNFFFNKKIFLSKIALTNFTIDIPNEKLVKFFTDNKSSFAYFGGDIEKLFNEIKQCQALRTFNLNTKTKEITMDDITNSLKHLNALKKKEYTPPPGMYV